MRNILVAGLIALAFGLVDARPASAAWECMGPAAACQKGVRTPAGSVKAAQASHRHARQQAAHRAGKTARHVAAHAPRKAKGSYATATSYSGGGASSGVASYYWQPQRVASGGWFNPNAMTAAHKTLPFGTQVQVTNLNNGRSVTVTINDRGPYVRGRVIDLSRAAASSIGMTGAGLARVSLTVVGRG